MTPMMRLLPLRRLAPILVVPAQALPEKMAREAKAGMGIGHPEPSIGSA